MLGLTRIVNAVSKLNFIYYAEENVIFWINIKQNIRKNEWGFVRNHITLLYYSPPRFNF